MPWGYITCQVIYFILGIGYVLFLGKFYKDLLLTRKLFVLFTCFTSIAIGVYLFQKTFNWFSEVNFGWWASGAISTFLVPVLFYWAFMSLLNIPHEIYKIWKYPNVPVDINMDHLDFDNLLVLELEFYKNSNDVNPLKVKVKAPENMKFGLWFQKFVDDYNLKFAKNPIEYKSGDFDSYGWIFFVKTPIYKRNLFIDPDLEIKQNSITEKMTIHAKRVAQTQESIYENNYSN